MRTFTSLLCSVLWLAVSAHGQSVTWQLDTSHVQVEGTSTIHDWTVQVPDVHGTLTMNGDQISNVELTFEVNTMVSGRGATMDDKTKKALKGDTDPQIIFKSTQITSKSSNQLIASGDLTIGGVTHKMDITCQSDGNGHFSAIVPLTFSQFEIEPPSALFGSIVCGEEITIHLELQFTH